MVITGKHVYVKYSNEGVDEMTLFTQVKALNDELRPAFALVKRDMKSSRNQPKFVTAEMFTFIVLYDCMTNEREMYKIIKAMGFTVVDPMIAGRSCQKEPTPLSAQLN